VKTDEVAFGPFRLDQVNALLRRGADRVLLTPKAFEVLCHLVQRPGQLVTKDDLMSAVWPGLHVSESSLTVVINALRTALGDDRSAPTYIETVTRRGYRFVAVVEPVGAQRSGQVVARPHVSLDDDRQANAWVGRAAPLKILERALQIARSGRRQAVFVTGEAGIGKTTLVEMALRLIGPGGIDVMRCVCNELFGAHEAFLPLIGGLHELCRNPRDTSLLKSLRVHAPTWLTQMPLVDQERAAIEREVFGSNRERMLLEFCDVMEDLASQRPWVMVLEDLHWSDPATVDAISRLARRDRPVPLLIIATYRPTDVSARQHPISSVHRDLQIQGRCVEASLDGLTRVEVEEHLSLRFDSRELASVLAERVFARTEGQPLFVVALVDHLVAQKTVARIDGEWRLVDSEQWMRETPPRDIRETILRKIASLSPFERSLLDVASAAGPTFSALLIAGAMDRDVLEVEEICEQLVRASGVLSATGIAEWPNGGISGEYAFIHALYQQVLYEQLSPARRANAHRRLAESLERGHGAAAAVVAPALAMHFEKGREFEKTLLYLSFAAESSARRFNVREAAGYLSRALEVVTALPSEARAEARVRLLLQRAWAWRAGGEFVAALDDLKAMVSCAAELGNIREEISALVNLSRFQLYVDRRQCLEVASRAVLRSRATEDPALRALAEGNLANLHLMLQPWRDEDANASRLAIGMIDDSQDLSARARRYSMEMTLAFLSSNYEACCEATLRGRELARMIGDVYLYVIYNFVESIALIYAGKWGRVRDLAGSALTISERNFNAQASALCRLTIAWLHVEAQDFRQGLREAERALNPGVESNPFSYFIGRIVLAKAYLGMREFAPAQEQIAAMARRMENEGVAMETAIVPHFVLVKCSCFLGAGDLENASREAERLYALATAAPDRQFVAFALEAMARIADVRGEHATAASHLAKATRLVRKGQFPLPARLIYATAANLLERRGREVGARVLRMRREGVIRSLANSLASDDVLRGALMSAGAADANAGRDAVPAIGSV
jgi:DNA-binding winged helix-turn-helix (wHTH) protein